MSKTIYRLAAYTSLAFGLAGILLPLLPTTPFVLLAAWCASRSSPAFESWLMGHSTFGPMIRGWQTRRAVSVRARWMAGGMLLSSWLILVATGSAAFVLALTGLFFLGLMMFLITRPSI